jgi:hypothetical protein
MDTLHARADWESVGDRWFRKTQQYTAVFDQDLDLDNYIVAGAPYAGALGESRNYIRHHSVIMSSSLLMMSLSSH